MKKQKPPKKKEIRKLRIKIKETFNGYSKELVKLGEEFADFNLKFYNLTKKMDDFLESLEEMEDFKKFI